MTGGVVVVLGETGRNFAAGMSGGIAYVYDPRGDFAGLVNPAMVAVSTLEPTRSDRDAPAPAAPSVRDSGMGDPLHHDVERLRILVERHHRHTGSARAGELLADWPAALGHFVKVTPNDYRRALLESAAERAAAPLQAAE
jgi:glutamate synthase (NADPH/NADH) large chain